MQDLKFAVRALRKNPGFALVAVLTLALGIGPTTAVFSAVNTILLSPLPYLHPERLAVVSETLANMGELPRANDEGYLGMAQGEYLDYRDRNRSFSQVAAYQDDAFNLTGAGTPLRITADRATASLFPLLGVEPAIGRTFSEAETLPAAGNVAVLAYDLWQNQYGGDPKILGTSIKLDEKPYTVIGVMPASFRFPSDAAPASERVQLWVPLTFSPDLITDRLREFGIHFMGRLKPGISVPLAEQDAQRIANEFMQEHSDVYSGNLRVAPHAFPYSAYSVAKIKPLLFLLIAAVSCVLLIVCANVANLLLARAANRSREMAIRAAIGAQRSRIVRQCLVESGLLSLVGGVAGVLLAFFLLVGLRYFGPRSLVRLQDVSLHPAALAFTLVLSLGTSIAFGFVPAWRLSRTSPQSCIKESQAGPGPGAHAIQSRLIVGEIAAALLLLIGSTLLVKSFVRVLNVPFGFDPEGAIVVRTVFDRPRYPETLKREAVQKELLERLSRLPGVSGVAAASHLPLSDARQIGFRLEHADANDFHWAENSLVSPGYFRVMGISILRGRDFTYDDGRGAPPAAIVNEAFAKAFLPGHDPIGQRFYWGDRALFTVVGVVNDVRISALDAAAPPMIYDSMFQVESGASSRTALVLRLSLGQHGAEQGLYRAAQQQVWSLDKDLPTYETTTLAALVSDSVAQRRFTTLLMGSFAIVALLLATVGLFGVISYVVSERKRELAVRIALGARKANIGWMILGKASTMAITGCGLGLLAYVAASRLIRSSLFAVSVFDPTTLLLAPVLLAGIALLAAYWPARRAMRSDPMAALRYE